MKWWQNGILYQVYPRSFQDSNNDGVGDLNGIEERLDYLHELGITAVWVSPFYPSPMADFGYDIADYCGVHPLFGTLSDFDRLLASVHKRKMKLILDLVPNHSSDQHPWFLESRSSRQHPRRDWYIWADAKPDGSPPNNWLSVFGGSAWQWDAPTGQYYYHAFLKEQPDLNWRNPEVKKAMFEVMHFWLKKGVDGFRVDVMWHMIKDDQLRDNPVNPDYKNHQSTYDQLIPVYSTDQPEVHAVVRQMRQVVDQYEDRLLIGEIYLPVHRLVAYYGEKNSGAHLPFNFQLLTLPWDARRISETIDQYEGVLPPGAWPNWVLGNHDQPRIASRVGLEQARIAALLLLTLRGTPTIYYGEEIGMTDVPLSPEEIRDPQGLNMPDRNLSRDPQRTPMQWDSSRNAGFSAHNPWLPLPANFRRINVAAQRDDQLSMFTFYKRLIRLRQQEPAFYGGTYEAVYSDDRIIAYRRVHERRRFMVILNLTHRPVHFHPDHGLNGTIELSTLPEREGQTVNKATGVHGDEGMIIRLSD